MEGLSSLSSLSGMTALIYGGGGVMGGAIARAMAQHGARVVVAGRTKAKVERVASEICASGGEAEAVCVDALDERAVTALTELVVARGRLDIVVDALGVVHAQGVGLAELSLEAFELPIATYTRSLFLIAKAAARPMVAQRSGVILTMSVPGAQLIGAGYLGHGVAYAGIEVMTRLLAAELGGSGVRVAGIRPDATPEALLGGQGSHATEMLGLAAASVGLTLEQMLAGRAESATMLKRLPTLAQIAETAVFLASPSAGAITGTVVNLTCGSVSW